MNRAEAEKLIDAYLEARNTSLGASPMRPEPSEKDLQKYQAALEQTRAAREKLIQAILANQK